MARPIPRPDFDISGMEAFGESVFAVDRRDLVPTRGYRRAAMGDWGEDYAQMEGALDFFRSVGGAIVKPIKAVGKGVVNAAASRVGLGPIFPGSQTAAVVQGQAPPPPTNYKPFIIAGAVGLGLLGVVLIATRK